MWPLSNDFGLKKYVYVGDYHEIFIEQLFFQYSFGITKVAFKSHDHLQTGDLNVLIQLNQEVARKAHAG